MQPTMYCGVCGRNSQCTNNEMKQCVNCAVCVHATCCAAAENSLDEVWLCSICSLDDEDDEYTGCCACASVNPLLYKIPLSPESLSWIHTTCKMTYYEKDFLNESDDDEMECIFCKSNDFKMIPFRGNTYCHVTCLLEEGYSLNWISYDSSNSITVANLSDQTTSGDIIENKTQIVFTQKKENDLEKVALYETTMTHDRVTCRYLKLISYTQDMNQQNYFKKYIQSEERKPFTIPTSFKPANELKSEIKSKSTDQVTLIDRKRDISVVSEIKSLSTIKDTIDFIARDSNRSIVELASKDIKYTPVNSTYKIGVTSPRSSTLNTVTTSSGNKSVSKVGTVSTSMVTTTPATATSTTGMGPSISAYKPIPKKSHLAELKKSNSTDSNNTGPIKTSEGSQGKPHDIKETKSDHRSIVKSVNKPTKISSTISRNEVRSPSATTTTTFQSAILHVSDRKDNTSVTTAYQQLERGSSVSPRDLPSNDTKTHIKPSVAPLIWYNRQVQIKLYSKDPVINLYLQCSKDIILQYIPDVIEFRKVISTSGFFKNIDQIAARIKKCTRLWCSVSTDSPTNTTTTSISTDTSSQSTSAIDPLTTLFDMYVCGGAVVTALDSGYDVMFAQLYSSVGETLRGDVDIFTDIPRNTNYVMVMIPSLTNPPKPLTDPSNMTSSSSSSSSSKTTSSVDSPKVTDSMNMLPRMSSETAPTPLSLKLPNTAMSDKKRVYEDADMDVSPKDITQNSPKKRKLITKSLILHSPTEKVINLQHIHQDFSSNALPPLSASPRERSPRSPLNVTSFQINLSDGTTIRRKNIRDTDDMFVVPNTLDTNLGSNTKLYHIISPEYSGDDSTGTNTAASIDTLDLKCNIISSSAQALSTATSPRRSDTGPCLYHYSTEGCRSGRLCQFSHINPRIGTEDWMTLRTQLVDVAKRVLRRNTVPLKPAAYIGMYDDFTLKGYHSNDVIVRYCYSLYASIPRKCNDNLCSKCHEYPEKNSKEELRLRKLIFQYRNIDKNTIDLKWKQHTIEVINNMASTSLSSTNNNGSRLPRTVSYTPPPSPRSPKNISLNQIPCFYFHSKEGCSSPSTCIYLHSRPQIGSTEWYDLKKSILEHLKIMPIESYRLIRELTPRPYLGMKSFVWKQLSMNDILDKKKTCIQYCFPRFTTTGCNDIECTKCHEYPLEGTGEYTYFLTQLTSHTPATSNILPTQSIYCFDHHCSRECDGPPGCRKIHTLYTSEQSIMTYGPQLSDYVKSKRDKKDKNGHSVKMHESVWRIYQTIKNKS